MKYFKVTCRIQNKLFIHALSFSPLLLLNRLLDFEVTKSFIQNVLYYSRTNLESQLKYEKHFKFDNVAPFYC